jgi:hypothetical protein
VAARVYPITLTNKEVEVILSWAAVCENEGFWTATDDRVRSRLSSFLDNLDLLEPIPDVREPTDDEIYNGFGREGGISYDPYDEPGSLGENDWRL